MEMENIPKIITDNVMHPTRRTSAVKSKDYI
jgi:hypothetical protein